MKKHFIYTLIFFIFQTSIYAQINIGGKPLSFSTKNLNKNIPLILLQKQNNKKLIAEAETNNSKDKPWQFGKNINVSINLKKQAIIENLPNGKLYRLSIKSEDAKSLNLRFSNFKIPEKSSLYIYNNDKTEILGAFTNANNQKNKIFATSILQGDEIILEYYEPNNAEFKGSLIIDRITHGFRSPFNYTKSFGNSGECNINVACDDGTWQNEIKSVCLLLTGGSAFCTGALINNTLEDGTPYILTANHCYRDPSDMVFMFNWQSATCDNPINSPSHNDLSGAKLIARNSASDFCLLKMNDVPPYTYNTYYAGWNANDNPSSKSIGIHHPSGDIKKISYDNDASISDQYMGTQDIENSHWQVTWDAGTTEGGSSGSPLFNENHEIIGQLHGGYASCTNLDASDWYGKFSYSWNYEDTLESRLKDWLNPTNSSINNFNGYDPNIPIADNDAQLTKINSPNNSYFQLTEIIPSFQIRNRGNNNLTSLKITYEINNNSISKNWNGNLSTGETANIDFDKINLESGNYFLKVYIENPNNVEDGYKYNDTLQKQFIIYEPIFKDDFEDAKAWYLTGEFEIDKPEGLGGETAYSDPTFATSGNNILGTDLTGLGQHKGDYEPNIDENEFAQSPVIDCRNYKNTLLTFNRWLGVDKSAYDKVTIKIKNDENNWLTLWYNNSKVTDYEWKEQNIDISDFADGHKIIIRYSINRTNHAEQYCGWNIDDFLISGIKSDTILKKENNIKIYPNPSFGYFNIEINDEITKNALITVSDIAGKIIFKKQFLQNEIKTIETSAYKKSIIEFEINDNISNLLIVKVQTDNTVFSDKIIYFKK